MFWLILIFLYLSRPVMAQAQVPLFYQLLEAYHPDTYSAATVIPPPPPITITPTPVPTKSGKVLGVSITAAPTDIPNPPAGGVGGEGKVVTVAVLGDSMIDTLGPGLPALKKSLNQYFPTTAFNLLNYGYGSRDVEFGLYRLTNDYDYLGQHIPSLISQKPDIVVVESFAYNNFGNTQGGINRHTLALDAIITTLHSRLPQAKIVIAATIAPNSVTFSNGVKNLNFSALDKVEKTSTIKLYLQNAINFANSNGLPLADAYHLSLFNNEGSTEFINPNDNLHPSAAGATLFSDIIADTISRNRLLD